MTAMKKPRQTSLSNPPDRWNLSDLVNEPVRKLEQHLASLEADVAQFEAARQTLRPDMASSEFQSIIKVSERVTGNLCLSVVLGKHEGRQGALVQGAGRRALDGVAEPPPVF
jgi:hypothetical protein